VRQPSPGARAGAERLLRSGVAAPIRVHTAVQAVVLIGYRGEHRIEQEDVGLLTAFADLAQIAWRNAADHAAVRRAAELDSLTGCLNHGAFQGRLREEIARAERTGEGCALVLVDLNEFKAVNDTFGHLAGDALLRRVAEGLRASVRPYDHVGRYGGDEFAVLLPATDDDVARRLTDRVIAVISAVELAGGPRASASAGIAGWRPGDTADAMIERADHAMLEVKRTRRRVPDGYTTEEHAIPGSRERQRVRRLATAARIGARLARLLDEREIVDAAIVDLAASLGYEDSIVVRGEPDGLAVAAIGRSEDADHDDPASSETLRAAADAMRERRTELVSTSTLAVPVYVAGVVWGAIAIRSGPESPLGDADAELVQRVADHLGAALQTARVYDELEQTHEGTAAALAAALEAKDSYTGNHARSIADLAVAVAAELGLDDVQQRAVRYGALFHDIGKIAIPDAILNKPGPLTADELAVVRTHPEVGEQILSTVPFLAEVREIVRHDHERWDGAGYPDGLSGERIPIGARIVLVVDAYHAMRSDRPYRRRMRASSARAELLRHAGTQFDPAVVQALLTVLEREPEVELESA
jgi:diguanylate cyclase (GGDEF)-like protein/putative nucleotidyltransferase with HDIG domain